MKLTIERAALLKSLTHVQSVVERRNTIPILSNILLRAENDRLSLTATDMDLEVIETTTAEVSEAGATTTPAHTLYEIVRKLPDGSQVQIALEPGAGRLTLSAGRSKFNLAVLPVDDFPVMSGGDLPVSFGLAAAELRGLIDRAEFAISTEETRYYLNGIYFHATDAEGTKSCALLRPMATVLRVSKRRFQMVRKICRA